MQLQVLLTTTALGVSFCAYHYQATTAAAIAVAAATA
jgi:hypothetical protein